MKNVRPGIVAPVGMYVPIQAMKIISDYRQLHWFCNTCETQIGIATLVKLFDISN